MSFDFIETELSKVVEISTKKCDSSSINVANYISTENMLPGRQGITISSGIPDVKKINYFEIGDTLFSNIRTYFKKVWFASFNGGASPDVLIFRSTSKQLTNEYLYLILSCDDFIDYTHLTSKGAKMPRGDKGAMMNYKIKLPCLNYQNECTKIIFTLNNKIAINNLINQTLEQMAQALFKSWFVDFEPVKAKMAVLENGGTLEEATLVAMSVISGKDEKALAHFKKEQPEKYAELKATAELFPSAMQESELGEIPEGWGINVVEQVVTRLKIKNTFKSEEVKIYGKYPVLEQGSKIYQGYHDNDPLFKASIEEPLFIFGDHTCVMHLSVTPFDVSKNTLVIKGKQFNTYWVYFSLLGKQKFQEYKRHWSDFKVKEIIVPLDEKGVALTDLFAVKVKENFEFLEKNRQQSMILQNIRDSLLPKLLSGEITLPEAEEAIKN